jgi:membrane protein
MDGVASEPAEPVRASFAERLVAGPLQLGRDWVVRFVELQGFDRAVALAGQAFTALVPLLIVYSALVSEATGRDFADQLIHVFDLSGSAAAAFRRAFAPAGDVENQVSAIGFVLLVGSALAFTRALQRLYQLAWDQPSLGLKAAQWGLTWLTLDVAFLTLRPVLLSGTDGVIRLGLSLALTAVAWLVTPFLLLARRIGWRRLLPTALLTSAGMTALAIGSAVWMPRTVASSAAQFGVIGVAFALLSWLVGAGLVLVLAASGGVVIDGRLEGARTRRRARNGRPRTAVPPPDRGADHPDG